MTKNSNNCNICGGDRLSGYLDGMLDVELMRKISAHLKDCPECRNEYEKLEKIKMIMTSLRSSTPALNPEFMTEALRTARQSLRPVDKSLIFGSRGIRPGVIGTASACAALFGIFLCSALPTANNRPAPQVYQAPEQIDVNSMISAHANFLAAKQMSDPSNNRIIRSDLALQTTGSSQIADQQEASLGLADDANMD